MIVELSDVTTTVGELRELLARYDNDMPVVFRYPSGDHWRRDLAGRIRQVQPDDIKWSDYHGEFAPVGDYDSDDDEIETVEAIVIG